jgi:hypothetical protein
LPPFVYYANSVSMIKKSMQGKRGPKPTGQGKTIGVRLQPEELQRLEAWINEQPNSKLISKPEGIRQLLEIAYASLRRK